jgi:hypothetical protein
MANELDFLNMSEIIPHVAAATMSTSSPNGAAILGDFSGTPGTFPENKRHAVITRLTIENSSDSAASFSLGLRTPGLTSGMGKKIFDKCGIAPHSTLIALDKHTPIQLKRSPSANWNLTHVTSRMPVQLQGLQDSASAGALTATVTYYLFDSN